MQKIGDILEKYFPELLEKRLVNKEPKQPNFATIGIVKLMEANNLSFVDALHTVAKKLHLTAYEIALVCLDYNQMMQE